MQNSDFKMALADRLYEQLFNNGPLTGANSQARWREISQQIDRAIVAESARWGDVGSDPPITRDDDWVPARDYVSYLMMNNSQDLIAQARERNYYPQIDPPLFSKQGGLIKTGFSLTISAPGGTIYYTTDGSDPRMSITGEVAPSAFVYDAPLILNSTTSIKARLLDNNIWSALNEATFTIVEQAHRLRITEIMYNPSGGSQFEFIELKNDGETAINLADMTFEGIGFTFSPGTPPLLPGEFIVLVSDPDGFSRRYPDVVFDGVYTRQLSNAGEKITLKDHQGNVVISVAYDDENGWLLSPDGQGDSLVLVNLEGDPNDPKNWRASSKRYGSPDTDDPHY